MYQTLFQVLGIQQWTKKKPKLLWSLREGKQKTNNTYLINQMALFAKMKNKSELKG